MASIREFDEDVITSTTDSLPRSSKGRRTELSDNEQVLITVSPPTTQGETKRGRGRPPKYANDEERKVARAQKKVGYNQKYNQEHQAEIQEYKDRVKCHVPH